MCKHWLCAGEIFFSLLFSKESPAEIKKLLIIHSCKNFFLSPSVYVYHIIIITKSNFVFFVFKVYTIFGYYTLIGIILIIYRLSSILSLLNQCIN